MTHGRKKKVLILLNKSQPSTSETFITNHINYFNGGCINVTSYLPLESKLPEQLSVRSLYRRHAVRSRRQALKKKIKALNPDVALAEFGSVGAVSFRILHEIGLPFVVHFHGQDAHAHSFTQKYGDDYKEMFEKSKAIVVVSEFMKRAILDMGAPPEKIRLNVYGVDERKFEKVLPSANPPVIASIGRFVDKKAPYLTLLAFKKVNGHFPDAELVMIGDGYLLETCQRLAKALGVEEKVRFTGSLPHNDAIQMLRSARMLAMHSVVAYDGDSEGTPNVVLEAGCSGLPVVATRHAGIQDVVKPDETGYLVEEGDADGMANYMIQLLKSPQLCDQIGSQAREHILQHFRLENSLKKLETILFE